MDRMMLVASEKKEYKSLEIGQCPTVTRTVDMNSIHSDTFRTIPSAVPLPLVTEYKRGHDSLMQSWLHMNKALRADTLAIHDNNFFKLYDARSYRDIVDSVPVEVRFHGSRTEVLLYRFRVEQDRVFSQFVQEVAKVSGTWVASVSMKLNRIYYSDECEQELTLMQSSYKDRRLAQLIAKYKRIAQETIKEQYTHLKGAIAGDEIEIRSSVQIEALPLSVRFKHAGMFPAADSLCSLVDQLTSDVIARMMSI